MNQSSITAGNLILTPLSEDDFRRVGALIQADLGIKMTPGKKVMLETRLQKRLRALNLDSYAKYCDYLFTKEGRCRELSSLYDVITTNKTDFFREPSHFSYLTGSVIPGLLSGNEYQGRLNFWSAGCSTGEEPYTLAMILDGMKERFNNLQFYLLATDISNKVLDIARTAVYTIEQARPVPENLKRKYLLRSKNPGNNQVRIVPGIRAMVDFKRLNLMDEKFDLPCQMDVIFCRNVFIYFERKTQEQIIWKFHRHLKAGGFLFLGHSETLCNLDVPLTSVSPNVYKKSG